MATPEVDDSSAESDKTKSTAQRPEGDVRGDDQPTSNPSGRPEHTSIVVTELPCHVRKDIVVRIDDVHVDPGDGLVSPVEAEQELRAIVRPAVGRLMVADKPG